MVGYDFLQVGAAIDEDLEEDLSVDFDTEDVATVDAFIPHVAPTDGVKYHNYREDECGYCQSKQPPASGFRTNTNPPVGKLYACQWVGSKFHWEAHHILPFETINKYWLLYDSSLADVLDDFLKKVDWCLNNPTNMVGMFTNVLYKKHTKTLYFRDWVLPSHNWEHLVYNREVIETLHHQLWVPILATINSGLCPSQPLYDRAAQILYGLSAHFLGQLQARAARQGGCALTLKQVEDYEAAKKASKPLPPAVPYPAQWYEPLSMASDAWLASPSNKMSW